MGWAACLGMHHESVIGLRPDDATMTEIKSMLASEFVTISYNNCPRNCRPQVCRRTQRPSFHWYNVEKYVI